MGKHTFIVPLIFVINSLVAQTATPPALGDGSVSNPYQIATLNNLYWLSEQVGVMNAISVYGDKNYIQTANIDASATTTWGSGNGNSGWIPIGTFGENFTGFYDGQNYSISNLYVNRGAEGGLFGHLNGSTVQNVNVFLINLISPNYSGGAIASYNNGIIDNCSATGTITTQRFPGGLVGHNDGIISNSDATVAVTATGDGFSTFNGPGGFVGENDGTITNCYSTDVVNGWGSAGGFVHTNSYSGNITNSYTTCVVNGGTDSGGFVGINDGVINACYSTGFIFSGGERVGGFVGRADNSGSGSITNCFSLGDVTRNTGSVNTSYGAFVGRSNGTIAYCYTIGSVIYVDATDPTDKGFTGLHQPTTTYDSNFWDNEASNQTTATGATAKTTAEMKSHHTFTDLATAGLDTPWDFVTNPNDDIANNNYWDIDYSVTPPLKVSSKMDIMAINDNYPFLDYQNGGDTALPVELTFFTVAVTQQGVLCSWTTESEVENLGFLLERRTSGTGWQELASYKTDPNLQGHGTISSPTQYQYIDKLVETNTSYDYRLADVCQDGVLTYHAIRTVMVDTAPLVSVVKQFMVLPAYPNPFNPSTTITYGLVEDSKVSIAIYDITGQLIATLLNTDQSQGWHSIQWNGKDRDDKQVSAGIYLGKITSNNQSKTTKLMLLK